MRAWQQGKRHQRFAGLVYVISFHALEELRLQLMRHRHLAGRNLGLAGPVKTKLAVAQCLLPTGIHPYRWPKHPAGHGSPLIYIAVAGYFVERRASCLVREALKPLAVFVGLSQAAG
jgi:hypothetical protein